MSEYNAKNNRLVWFDIPIADLDRSIAFYASVLAIKVSREEFDGYAFGVLEHADGNGGCLVPKPDEISADRGVLCYLNAEGRIRDAVKMVEKHGGKVIEPIQSIGPHGFRAVVIDSEGNRVALHSSADA